MPTYDYRCDSCGARFDALQKITDEPIRVCPQCGGPTRRVIHPVGLVFRGSGFYSTDHRAEGAAASVPAAETGGAEGGKSDGSADTTSTAPAKESAKSGEPAAATTSATTPKTGD